MPVRVFPDTLEDKWLLQAHGNVPTRPAIMIIDMKGKLVAKKCGFLNVREVTCVCVCVCVCMCVCVYVCVCVCVCM